MSLIETLMQRLEQAQAGHAHQALSQPQGRDDFEYGRMCGIYAGIGHARTILTELISEDDGKDNEL